MSKEMRVSAGDARKKLKNSTGDPSAQQKRERERYASFCKRNNCKRCAASAYTQIQPKIPLLNPLGSTIIRFWGLKNFRRT